MKGVKKILIGLIIILVVYFGYELYLKYAAEQPGYYDFENGIIQEKINGDVKVIEEKSLGLRMEVPSNWEKELVYMGLILQDSYINVEVPLRDFRDWTEGCSIGISVENDETINGISTFDEEYEKMEYIGNGDGDYCNFSSCEIINAGEKNGIKGVQEFEETNFDGDIQYVDISIFNDSNRKIYKINSLLSTQVHECEEHLNNFINSLEFK